MGWTRLGPLARHQSRGNFLLVALQTHPPPPKVCESPIRGDPYSGQAKPKHFDRLRSPLVPVLMKLYTTPPSILTLVTWVPQNRQGKLHLSLRGCSAPPPFCRKALHQGRLTGPSALQGLLQSSDFQSCLTHPVLWKFVWRNLFVLRCGTSR